MHMFKLQKFIRTHVHAHIRTFALVMRRQDLGTRSLPTMVPCLAANIALRRTKRGCGFLVVRTAGASEEQEGLQWNKMRWKPKRDYSKQQSKAEPTSQ